MESCNLEIGFFKIKDNVYHCCIQSPILYGDIVFDKNQFLRRMESNGESDVHYKSH